MFIWSIISKKITGQQIERAEHQLNAILFVGNILNFGWYNKHKWIQNKNAADITIKTNRREDKFAFASLKANKPCES